MIDWRWCRFAELGVDNLYDALALRCQAFIVEQVPYLDPDGLDRVAWHLLGRDRDGALVAYLRIVDAGYKFDEPSIGRVVCAASVRGQGLGRELMRRGLAQCAAAFPGQAVRIGAQAHLQRFYAEFGFAPVGGEYDEDGIAHVEMLRIG